MPFVPAAPVAPVAPVAPFSPEILTAALQFCSKAPAADFFATVIHRYSPAPTAGTVTVHPDGSADAVESAGAEAVELFFA